MSYLEQLCLRKTTRRREKNTLIPVEKKRKGRQWIGAALVLRYFTGKNQKIPFLLQKKQNKS
jgi:hypothetical protein